MTQTRSDKSKGKKKEENVTKRKEAGEPSGAKCNQKQHPQEDPRMRGCALNVARIALLFVVTRNGRVAPAFMK